MSIITIYHTADAEKISDLISPILSTEKGSTSQYILIGKILNCDRIPVGGSAAIRLVKVDSVGHDHPKDDGTNVITYLSNRKAILPGREELGILTASIFALYKGYSPKIISPGTTSKGLNVLYGHFDIKLSEFDINRAEYRALNDYLQSRLDIKPVKVVCEEQTAEKRNQTTEIDLRSKRDLELFSIDGLL